jgi:hydrogenase-4 component B
MLLALTAGPMAAGVIAFIAGKKCGRPVRDYFADLVALAELALLIYCSYAELCGRSVSFVARDLCGLGISLKLDGFRIIYGLVAAFMWAATTVFSREYMAHYPRTNRYYFFFLFTLGATVGVFLSADLFTTFLFFEIMSFTSYAWVAHDETGESLRAAETYLCVAVIGGMVMLMGLFLLYSITGTLRMDELHEAVTQAVLFDPSIKSRVYIAGGCMLFGFGAKAGMFPLHIWLPKAHPVAPAPASALLSGILTKSGIFGILVISSQIFLHDPSWGFTILVLGVITMFTGALLGVFSINIKRTLACSSMSQIGFILVGIGMQGLLGEENALAIRGTVLHMVNHSLIKLVLFMCAGVIYMNLHELDINKIRGFGRGKIVLTAAFLIGGLSISGIPGFSGYVSKTLLHESIVEYMNEAPAGMYGTYRFIESVFLLTGGMTLAYMMKLFVAVFIEERPKTDEAATGTDAYAGTGMYEEEDGHGGRENRYMNDQSGLAVLISAAVLFIIGIAPYRFMDRIAYLAFPFMNGESFGGRVNYFSGENLKGGLISISLGLIIYFGLIRKLLMKKDENGNKVYIDAWPAWLDIENLIYRPALQHIIPFILAFILRIFDRMADHAVSIIRRTILKEIEPHRPLLYGNIFTHAVGMAMDGLEKLLNNTVRKKNPKNVNYEKKLALSAEQLIKTARLTSRSVSFGLMMFSLGCILTLIYLIYVLVINMM